MWRQYVIVTALAAHNFTWFGHLYLAARPCAMARLDRFLDWGRLVYSRGKEVLESVVSLRRS